MNHLLRISALWVLIFVLSGFVYTAPLSAQASLSLVGQLPYSEQLSNLWGYVDEDSGVEYAIVGVYNGTSIVSLQNPALPVEVAFVPGPEGIWREVKTWGHYAYVTNETSSGLHIIDLANLPQSVNSWFWTGVDDLNYSVDIQTIHTIATDEKGYAYLWGSNEDAVIIDLNANPENPPIVGIYDTRYVHDGFVRNDTMWTAEVYDGVLSVVNITDRSNPIVMASFATPNNFTHNCALTDDGNTLFTTDEVSGSYIAAYDVSDLGDINEIDRIRTTPNTGSIVHNVYTVGNFLVSAYYRDGVTIHDATNPNAMVLVANYDTAPTISGNGFNGCWGVYPYFPSGLIIASDMEEGLFVLQPTYVQAAYLNGSITDSETGMAIVNATITITEVPSSSVVTDFSGIYQTGVAATGSYTVTFSAPGYLPVTYTVTLNSGETLSLNAALVSLPQFNFTGSVVDAETGTPIPNAIIILTNPETTVSTTSDLSGQFTINNVYTSDYNVLAGKWGYITQETGSQWLSTETGEMVVQLPKGYYDDFALDFGWTVEGDAPRGIWERGEPNGTSTGGQPMNPDDDLVGDIGDACFVTGNSPDPSVSEDDVDNGYTRLTSPPFDLTDYIDPQISYYRWFANAGGSGTPNDHLIISLTNGMNTVVIEDLNVSSAANNWAQTLVRVIDYITPTANMRLIFETSDAPGSGHVVEAATDWFVVTDLAEPNAINIPQTDKPNISVSPNPFSNQTTFTLTNLPINDKNETLLRITNIQGQTLMTIPVSASANNTITFQNHTLKPGIYFYSLEQNNLPVVKGKMVVVN